MEAQGNNDVDPANIMAEVDRLTASSILHGSETLCRLLRFLVQHRLEQGEAQLKEHEIATRLLGRPSGFDPRIDPVVRVQLGRLRSKLVEYYATEGARDELVVEIPKGSYAPHFLPRKHLLHSAGNGAGGTVHQEPTPDSPPGRVSAGSPRLALAGLAAAAIFAAGLVTGGLGRTAPATTRLAVPEPSADTSALNKLWSPFISTPDRSVLVVFSNALFTGRPETGLRYFEPSRDRAADLLDHYTGIGEVFAVSSLQRLLGRLHADLRLKRGQLLTWDDAENRPVVFIGSPAENLRLRDVPFTQRFVFEQRRRGQLRELIVRDVSPPPGHPAEFRADPKQPERADYALITRTVGLDGVSPILMLAGITTLGTQAAAEFVSDNRQVQGLAERLGVTLPASFSAVLSVEVRGGVPVRSRLTDAAPARAPQK